MLFKARGDAAEMLDPVEEALDAVALLVEAALGVKAERARKATATGRGARLRPCMHTPLALP